jgi:hypothetical protein
MPGFRFAPAAMRRGTTTYFRLSSPQYISTLDGGRVFLVPSGKSRPVVMQAAISTVIRLLPLLG